MSQLPLPLACQRWRDRREVWRPAGELFDPRAARVDLIEEADAKRFVIAQHYSASYPAARLRVGLFVGAKLVGVTVFSVPMSQHIVPKYFDGIEPNAGVELGRLVLLDEVAANAESWFVARAFKLLRAELPQVQGVVSYSDPVARMTAAGTTVKPGHVGTVYQALNAAYRGRAKTRSLILSADGRVVSARAISKLRNAETGAAYAYQQLLACGAPRRRRGEADHAYVKRALSDGAFRKLQHPGNHTYSWWLGPKNRAPAWAALPYPKKENI